MIVVSFVKGNVTLVELTCHRGCSVCNVSVCNLFTVKEYGSGICLVHTLCSADCEATAVVTGKSCVKSENDGLAVGALDHGGDDVAFVDLLGGDFSCMHPKLAEFLKQAYAVVQPCSYAELLKLIGLAHGTGTWKNNAEDLLTNGKCRLADIPATRDEVFMMIRDAMQEQGVYDTGFAYDVANKARRGYYQEHGMDDYTNGILQMLGLDDWFGSFIRTTHYMSTKALAVLELKYSVIFNWYQVYCPSDYQQIMADYST